jgi:hypothetical protein
MPILPGDCVSDFVKGGRKITVRDLGKILCIQEFQSRILVTMEFGLCELKGDELVELKVKASS